MFGICRIPHFTYMSISPERKSGLASHQRVTWPCNKVKTQWSKTAVTFCIWGNWGLSKGLFQDQNLWPKILFLLSTEDWSWWTVTSATSSSPSLTARATTLFTDLNISSCPLGTVGSGTPSPAPGTGPFRLRTWPRNDLAGWVCRCGSQPRDSLVPCEDLYFASSSNSELKGDG